MKLAHLILAHNEPKQLERLISRLAHPDADIYIHIDKKTSIVPFEYLKNIKGLFFIQNRVKVYWGSYNMVEATLNGFKEILSSGNTYQYLNLLSGQDYPLKPAAFIHRFLDEQAGKVFMNFLQFDPDWTEALPRIQQYHFNNWRMQGRYILQSIVNKLLPARRMPNGLIPVGRSQWFTIPIACVSYLLEYWQHNPKLRRFIKLTWAPDEFILQTILYNSDYQSHMVNDDLRYIDWSAGGVSPKTLTMYDTAALINSGKLFARKFDKNTDSAILDLLDQTINPDLKAYEHEKY
jgi:hypothetical protein